MLITFGKRRKAVSSSIVVGILIAIAVAAGVAIYFAIAAKPSPASTKSRMQTTSLAQVTIPSGAGSLRRTGINHTPYPNSYFSPDTIVVVIGLNNAVVCTNKDDVAHTVTSLSVPSGASSFNSGSTFSQTFPIAF